jgi:hypothetical protein
MEERGALHPDVDECRLHAGQHASDFAENDVSDAPAMRGALYLKLGNDAVFDEGNAGFAEIYVDD